MPCAGRLGLCGILLRQAAITPPTGRNANVANTGFGMLHVIAYDITIDGKRVKLAKMLLDYGDRVQNSVFEADIEAREVSLILKRASDLVDVGDSLRIYPICKTCVQRAILIGRQSPEVPPDWVLIG
jgi:CRISPR-associated protein Cas2